MNARRTTGQPNDGLTTMQVLFLMAGSLLCMAAVAFTVFAIAPIGFAVIATVAYCLGYFVLSGKQLTDTRYRGADIDSQIKVLSVVQLFYFAFLVYIWLAGASEKVFPARDVITGIASIHLCWLAFITGRFKRACGKFYSL